MGRAPTSGYCHNCRARRVKCDKSKPVCRRCSRYGHECRGYDLPMRMESRFVVPNDGDDGQRVVVRRAARAAAISSAATAQAPRKAALRRGSELPSQIPLAEEELIFGYFFRNYVWAHFWRPIMVLLPSQSGEVVYCASLAVAAGTKARAYNDKALNIRALRMYGKAVTLFRDQFSQAIGQKAALARLTREVITICLFTYAVNRDLSLVELEVLDGILHFCGPEYFQEDALLTTFRSCRATIVCRALNKGQRTFLEQPEWCTIPWLKSPKTANDELEDVFVHLPALCEEICRSGEIDSQRRPELLRRVDALWQQLDDWRWRWEAANPRAATTTTRSSHDVSKISEPALAAMLASRIDMVSIENALDITLYNATRAYVLRLRHLLVRTDRESPDDRRLSPSDSQYMMTTLSKDQSSPLLLPGEVKLPCQYIIEAARVMPYLSEHLAERQDPVPLVLAPTGIIISALMAQPELEDWVPTLRSRIIYLQSRAGELSPFDIFT